MSPKFKQFFNQMLEDNKALFADFKIIHDQYASNRSKYQAKFNRQGKQVVKTIQDYENKLCGHSEKGQFGKFSAKLAEKFQSEVKSLFPFIDFVGITVTTSQTKRKPSSLDSLRKIKLQPTS